MTDCATAYTTTLSLAAREALDGASTTDIVRFVETTARSVHARYWRDVPFCDLVSYGMMGFLDAAQRYDPKDGVSLTQFAFLRTYGAMVDGARKWTQRHTNRHKRRIQVEKEAVVPRRGRRARASRRRRIEHSDVVPLSLLEVEATLASSGMESAWASIRSTPQEVARLVHQQAAEGAARGHIVEALSRLSPRDQMLLQCLYAKELSMGEAADALGVTKSCISRRHHRIVQSLRRSLRLTGVLPHLGERPERMPLLG